MAKAYRRPLLTFYMGAPPAKADRGQDFRTLPARQTDSEPLVDALIRDVRARQAAVRAILEDEDDVRVLRFVGSADMREGIARVGAAINERIGFDLTQFRAQRTAEAAFAYLRSKVEAIGVFVLLMGNLGSRQTTLEVSAFRGFALADDLAPFIVINDQDAHTAWSFTLLHELAHLWLGQTGVSGASAEGRIERFCNDVASHLLLPPAELREIGLNPAEGLDDTVAEISAFAAVRLVSRPLVAYRLFRANIISAQTWQALSERFEDERRRDREARRERQRGRETGPSYYVVRRHRLGGALLRFVAENMSEGQLTPTRASKILGVKPRSVEPLLRDAVPTAVRGA
jgi:Zn-dependent peptidase ImmA (M78 family)